MMPISLMIVDDAPDLRRLIARQFEKIGCTVVAEAGDGAEAVRLFEQLRPDLVTLDLVMPHKEGFDAISTFRALRRLAPTARIIVMSTTLPTQTRELFAAEGAFAFVEKPFGYQTMRGLQQKLSRVFADDAPRARHG